MNENMPPAIALDQLCRAIAEPVRWSLIRVLCQGEALPVQELARRVGRPPKIVSKHLAMLRETGVIVNCYGRLYRMAPTLQPKPGERLLDLGHCIMKLDTPL